MKPSCDRNPKTAAKGGKKIIINEDREGARVAGAADGDVGGARATRTATKDARAGARQARPGRNLREIKEISMEISMKHFLICHFSLPTRVTGLASLLLYYSPAIPPPAGFLIPFHSALSLLSPSRDSYLTLFDQPPRKRNIIIAAVVIVHITTVAAADAGTAPALTPPRL